MQGHVTRILDLIGTIMAFLRNAPGAMRRARSGPGADYIDIG